MRYRRVVVRAFGGPEVLEIVEDEVPAPGQGEARVRVLAADVGFSDVNIRRGRYPGGPRPPFTPGYAIVGVVDALGPATTGIEVGQAVGALTFVGGYSQSIVLPAAELVPMPVGLDPAEAVTLVFNYLAAYQMLHRLARVTSGQRILVHGAGGGLGTAFLELGRLAGLVMYGTASQAKHGLVSSFGATPIDYRSEDFVARVAELTGGAGVDAAFDPMGSAHLRLTARTVRRGGALVAYGYYIAAARGRNAVLDVVAQYLDLARWRFPLGDCGSASTTLGRPGRSILTGTRATLASCRVSSPPGGCTPSSPAGSRSRAWWTPTDGSSAPTSRAGWSSCRTGELRGQRSSDGAGAWHLSDDLGGAEQRPV